MSRPLPPESLRASSDPQSLGFQTTAELQPPDGVIGQERAMSATAFGIALKAPGYNLFVVGPPATGKSSTMRSVFCRTAQAEPTPPDQCYVHNFDDPYRPRVLELPPGRGRELFKVKADFDESLPRTAESERLFARFVAGACREHDLRPFTAEAVARVIEHGARIAEHKARLSARFGELSDLLREASFFATTRGHEIVTGDDVLFAIEQKRYRSNLVEEQLARMTMEGEIFIDTAGEATGQVNGLEVYSVGDHTFGRPFRITARVRPGKPGVVDVERQVGLGGAIHSKGVLILQGFVSGHYATDRPLAMSASIVSEQSYDLVDGDSASCAELCALLSALAGVPLSQRFAVTGSINQAGAVQPVGGINEKIEGFFDLCRARGLSGEGGGGGVIIPAANVHHLMLRDDVVAAARAGQFRVYAVRTIDETLAILTGREAGERDANGQFAQGSVNWAVEARLLAFRRAVATEADCGD